MSTGGLPTSDGRHVSLEEASHELYSIATEVTAVHLVLTLLAVFILVFGMFSALVKERLYAGEAIVATGFGIIFGPYVAGLIDPRSWGNFDEVTLEFTRVVLALSVFAVGVELPRAYMARHWRSLLMVLGPLMVIGWLITAALIYALIPGLQWTAALIVAACLTPTDPILAASVVGKGKFAQKHVPSHIRHLLQAESGSNDGAAFPFLYLALFLNFRETRSIGHSVGYWLALVVLYQILLGVVIGAIVGIVARKVLKFSKRRALIDRESMVAMYVSLAIFTTAVTTLAGSDDLLAAFAAGVAFAWDDWFSESIEDSNFSNIIDLLINCATFIYIGATMPFNAFNDHNLTLYAWRLAVLGICILLVRRLPAMMALYKFIPDIKTFREAVFAGFFGPMGVGAIFIATLAITKMPTPNYPPEGSNDILVLTIQPIIYFIVLCSVIVHGMSIPFFNLGRRVHSISRTWTQNSNSEPNWLARVKRTGDGNIEINRDDDASPESAAKREKRRAELDLEAGERVIDDPGMDIGEMTERDYADEKRVRDPEKMESPVASSDGTVQGSDSSDKGKARARPAGNEDAAFRMEDERRERHDGDDREDEEEVWDEGNDIVIDRHHGDDIQVIHSGHSEGSRDGGSHGPGFPGYRMAEIAKMIEKGHDLAHKDHPKSDESKVDAKISGRANLEGEHPEERHLHQATEAVVRNEESRSRSPRRSLSSNRTRSLAGSKSPPRSLRRSSTRSPAPSHEDHGVGHRSDAHTAEGAHSGAPPAKPHRQMSLTAGLAQIAKKTPLRPAQPVRRQSALSPEEKYARDAWCRRERKDVDDDEVKAWISGKHLIIERNNGEDVEVVDANPDQSARERARRDPNLSMRAVPIDEIRQAKESISPERGASSSDPATSEEMSEIKSPRRFDLRAIADRPSVRRFLSHARTDSPASTQPRRTASPVQEDAEEEDGGNEERRPNRLRFAAGTSASKSTQPGPPSRKTGISLERSETTDSQVRFAPLPTPRGRKK